MNAAMTTYSTDDFSINEASFHVMLQFDHIFRHKHQFKENERVCDRLDP